MARPRQPDQLGLEIADGGPDRLRLAKHNADFTPQGAAIKCCLALREIGLVDPGEVKDPQPGAGVFGMAAHMVWPRARRTAVEIREEEAVHLAHNYDDHEIADYLALPPKRASVDAIVTNPSFELAMPVADKALVELRDGGWLGLLLRLTWGDHKDVSAWLREHPPWGCIELDGRLCFRTGLNPKTGNPYAEDSVTYRMIVWRKGMGRLTPSGAIDYQRYLKLARLEDHEREWWRVGGNPVRPGTEYMHPELEIPPLALAPG